MITEIVILMALANPLRIIHTNQPMPAIQRRTTTLEAETTETTADFTSTEHSGGYYATYEVTAYEYTGSPCADGSYPVEWWTAASNDPDLWHHTIYIDGVGQFYVHDTGGMASDVVDIYLGDYDTCIQFGRQVHDIYIVD